MGAAAQFKHRKIVHLYDRPQPGGRAGIDGGNFGVGVRRAQHVQPQRAVVRLVVDIFQPEQVLRYPEAVNPSVTLCGVDLPLLALAKAGSASDSARVVFARLRQFGAI